MEKTNIGNGIDTGKILADYDSYVHSKISKGQEHNIKEFLMFIARNESLEYALNIEKSFWERKMESKKKREERKTRLEKAEKSKPKENSTQLEK